MTVSNIVETQKMISLVQDIQSIYVFIYVFYVSGIVKRDKTLRKNG